MFNMKNPEDMVSSRHLGIAGNRVPIHNEKCNGDSSIPSVLYSGSESAKSVA